MNVRNHALALLLALVSTSFGNGGPVDMSHIASTGNLRLENRPEIRLLSENLLITVGQSEVSVRAEYHLSNTGESADLVYGFPVERFISEFDDYGEDITMLSFTADGTPLSAFEPLAGDTLDFEVEGMMQSGTAVSTWYPVNLHIERGAGMTLVVEYSVRPCFSDWENSKTSFQSHSYRYFRYLLAPSGSWGDGTAGSFSCRIDFTRLLENGGEVIAPPANGSWSEPEYGVHCFTASPFNMSSANPVEFVYDPSLWMLEDELREMSITPVRMSSTETLPPAGSNTYGAENLFDSDPSTAWAVPFTGNGDSPCISIDLEGAELGCVAIIGGYAKSGEAWNNNARPRLVRLTLFNQDNEWGSVNEVELPDTGYPGEATTIEAMKVLFDSGMFLPQDSLRLEILSVYPGLLCNDLCISELVLTGW